MEHPETHWQELFLAWPKEMPRRGVLVTTFGEQIPFSGFLVSKGFLFVERTTPDSIGGRAAVLPYESIAGLKFTDPVKPRAVEAFGFDTPASAASSPRSTPGIV